MSVPTEAGAFVVIMAAASPKEVCALDIPSVIALSNVNPDFWRIAGALSVNQIVMSEDGGTTFAATEYDDRCFRIDQERERERRLREAQRRA